MSNHKKPEATSSALKILIAGAYATGKTTLSTHLYEDFNSMDINTGLVSGIPRNCPFVLNTQQTVFASVWLVGEQMRAEIEASVGNVKVLICDRGIPDFFSHTRVLPLKSDKERKLFGIIQEISTNWSQTYDIVFWAHLDLNREIEADEIRVAQKEYQILMESSIRETFDTLHIVPVSLPSNLDDRIKIVKVEVCKILDKK